MSITYNIFISGEYVFQFRVNFISKKLIIFKFLEFFLNKINLYGHPIACVDVQEIYDEENQILDHLLDRHLIYT